MLSYLCVMFVRLWMRRLRCGLLFLLRGTSARSLKGHVPGSRTPVIVVDGSVRRRSEVSQVTTSVVVAGRLLTYVVGAKVTENAVMCRKAGRAGLLLCKMGSPRSKRPSR